MHRKAFSKRGKSLKYKACANTIHPFSIIYLQRYTRFIQRQNVKILIRVFALLFSIAVEQEVLLFKFEIYQI